MSSKIEISYSVYKEMLKDVSKLRALEAGGVDSWQFYDEALKELRKEEELEDLIYDYVEKVLDYEYPAGIHRGRHFIFTSLVEDIRKWGNL